MEMIERDRLAPFSHLVSRQAARLDVVLPQLAAAQAHLLHPGNRLGERPIAEAVALDANRDRMALLERNQADSRCSEKRPAAQRRAGGGM
jgi:hypothetical protein